jgi:membrane-associated phospholipid phosphatase
MVKLIGNIAYKSMKARICSSLLFCLCLFQHSYAQYDSVRRSDVIRFADGAQHNFTSPIRWQQRDWIKAGAVVLGTAAISIADMPINLFWHGKSSSTMDVVNDLGNSYGKPYSAYIVTGGFYLTGMVIKNEWVKETGLMLGTALLTSGVIESIAKPLFGRARPEATLDSYDFHPLSGEAKFHSLPSGHAAIAFTISFVLAKRVHSTPLKILFYSLAASTAFCRLYSNAHWFSDVGLGAVIAWFSASESVKHATRTKYKKHSKMNVYVRPVIGGLSLKIAFN